MAVTAAVQLESGRIVYARSDFSYPFQPRVPKKAWVILCKTDPAEMWTVWSGFGQTHPVWWSKRVCRNHRARFLAGRNRPATSFPLSLRLGPVVPQTMSRILLCKTSRPDATYLGRTVSGFGQMDPVWKQANVQESSDPLLANASQLIRTGCESVLWSVSGNWSGIDPAWQKPCTALRYSRTLSGMK